MKKFIPWLPLVGMFLLLFVIESVKPRPIDWKPSYSLSDEIPFGSSALFALSSDLFRSGKINISRTPLYNYLSDGMTDANTSYFIFNESFEPDPLDIRELLVFVENGGDMLIAASGFGESFMDSLKIKSKMNFRVDSASVVLKSLEEVDKNNFYSFRAANFYTIFDSLKRDSLQVLGSDVKNSPVFIRIDIGDGHLFLHSIPQIFTNYNLLHENNSDYIADVLSHLPDRNLIWDEYYKIGHLQISQSPISYILNQPALSWAYFLGITGILFFIFIEGRRRQRIIPIIEPLKNESLNFTRTIARLHFQQANHGETAAKIILLLNDFIQNSLKINIRQERESLIHQLLLKTSISEDELKALFEKTDHISAKEYSAESLKKLNKAVEEFYKKCKGSLE
ncbi:MAG: DUF4350 domain-containing protein [Calditrichaeota bacterium]|nr:DUF4350 domain-containing protein [Calditrichota bacterium]